MSSTLRDCIDPADLNCGDYTERWRGRQFKFRWRLLIIPGEKHFGGTMNHHLLRYFCLNPFLIFGDFVPQDIEVGDAVIKSLEMIAKQF